MNPECKPHAQNAGPQGPACAKPTTETLTPRNHLLGSSAVHVGLIEYNIRSHVCWPGGQHLLLAVNQIAGVESSQLKPMPMRNRVSRASLHAIPTKNTPVVIDVVDAGVAFCATHTILRGVVGGFDVDAVRRTIRRAEKTCDAFFQAVLVTLQHVRAAEAGFNARAPQRAFAIGIIFDGRWLKHLHEGDAHALGDGGDVF